MSGHGSLGILGQFAFDVPVDPGILQPDRVEHPGRRVHETRRWISKPRKPRDAFEHDRADLRWSTNGANSSPDP